MNKISYVIPCYGSEHTIIGVVTDIKMLMKQDLKNYQFEIILVNDGSPDRVHNVIIENYSKDKDIKYIQLSKNFSQHNAVMAGLHHTTGDVIICLDDDGQSPVYEVPKLLNELNEDVDVVYAKYRAKKHSRFRNFGSKINDYMLRMMLGKPQDLYISSFFAMKRYVKDAMIEYKNPYPYLGGLILRITDRIKNVETDHLDRNDGSSGYNIRKLLKLYVNGLTNFSVKPLRISLFFSVTFILIAVIASVYLVINKLLNPEIPVGWTSMMIVLLFVGAAITFLLGLIGEYIGRIYISINNIPQYVEVKQDDKKN